MRAAFWLLVEEGSFDEAAQDGEERGVGELLGCGWIGVEGDVDVVDGGRTVAPDVVHDAELEEAEGFHGMGL